jgi:hypothetical protein
VESFVPSDLLWDGGVSCTNFLLHIFEGNPEDFEEVYYEEPDLSGGVEGVDYTIAYGIGEELEEEADN